MAKTKQILINTYNKYLMLDLFLFRQFTVQLDSINKTQVQTLDFPLKFVDNLLPTFCLYVYILGCGGGCGCGGGGGCGYGVYGGAAKPGGGGFCSILSIDNDYSLIVKYKKIYNLI